MTWDLACPLIPEPLALNPEPSTLNLQPPQMILEAAGLEKGGVMSAGQSTRWNAEKVLALALSLAHSRARSLPLALSFARSLSLSVPHPSFSFSLSLALSISLLTMCWNMLLEFDPKTFSCQDISRPLPMSSEHGTHKTAKATCWPWLSGKTPEYRISVVPHFAWKH